MYDARYNSSGKAAAGMTLRNIISSLACQVVASPRTLSSFKAGKVSLVKTLAIIPEVHNTPAWFFLGGDSMCVCMKVRLKFTLLSRGKETRGEGEGGTEEEALHMKQGGGDSARHIGKPRQANKQAGNGCHLEQSLLLSSGRVRTTSDGWMREAIDEAPSLPLSPMQH